MSYRGVGHVIFSLHLGVGHSVLLQLEGVGHVFSNHHISKCSGPFPPPPPVLIDQPLKFKSSFFPKERNNLPIIDRIIEDTRFYLAFIDFFSEIRAKEVPDFYVFSSEFQNSRAFWRPLGFSHCLSKIIVAMKNTMRRKSSE